MKKTLFSLALSSVALLSTSCLDMLNEENHSKVMQDFMATPAGYGMALNSVYANMKSTYSDEGGIHGLIDATRLCAPSPQMGGLESGRASGATAQHLLARVYLTLAWVYDKDAANYPKNPHNKYYNPAKAKEYYELAYKAATKLIADAPHLGERNLNDGRCFSWFNPNPYTYEAFDNRQTDTRYQSTFQQVWYATKPVKGGKVNYTINGVNEAFNWDYTVVGDTALYYPAYPMTADDIRKKTQNRKGNHYIIFTPEAYNGRATFPTLTKFLDRTRKIPNDNSDRSYIIFPLSETYLPAAEAAFKLNDKINAAKYINLLRERARNKQTSAVGALDIAPADVTLDFILEERTRELLAEHCRWADLVRTGTLLERVRKYDDGKAFENIKGKHWLRPIPQNQIDRVTTGTPYPQNAEW